MLIEPTEILGLYRVRSAVAQDARGSFFKAFHAPSFSAAGLSSDWRESYCSTSGRGVIRGMHFQTPPADHAKLVFCLRGEVLDVVLDLRRGSPSEGRHLSFSLDEREGAGLYIPAGCAHGFLGVSETSTMLYMVTSVHDAAHDRGVAWDSFGFRWPVARPILSNRDRGHAPLATFVSPFDYCR